MAPGPLTVFAPNDDAFAEVIKALKTTKLGLMELPNLGDILKNHVVAGAIMSSDLKEGQARAPPRPSRDRSPSHRTAPGSLLSSTPRFTCCRSALCTARVEADLRDVSQELTTLGGGKLKVSLAGGASVNGIKVTKADIKTTNGVIHVRYDHVASCTARMYSRALLLATTGREVRDRAEVSVAFHLSHFYRLSPSRPFKCCKSLTSLVVTSKRITAAQWRASAPAAWSPARETA